MSQRVKGVMLLLICVGIIALASQGATVEEKDATPVLFLFPLGMYLLFASEKTAKEKAAPRLDNLLAAHITHIGDKPILTWASPIFKGVR